MLWTVTAFLLICAGHTELWVTLVNRLYGLPWSCAVLHRIRRVHDVAILAFPVVICVFPGYLAPRHFLEGEWSLLGPVWIALFVLCSVGLAGLLLATAVWWIRTRRCMAVCDSRRIVAAPRTSRDPAAAAFVPMHLQLLRGVPGNQQFQIEVNEKTLIPPLWPEPLDGFTALHLSDWHLSPVYPREFFEAAAAEALRIEADLIAFTGDLFDDLRCLDWLPSTLGTLSAPHGAWFILGNHDSWLDHELIRARMVDLGWNEIAGRTHTVDFGGGTLQLGGDETPWFGKRPPLDRDIGAPRLLLAHTPDAFPWGAGAEIDVILAGHNHGGQVLLPLIGPVYSPSLYGCRYPSGVFEYHRTVMHVSRGLAGRHPLRIGCCPEITRLTIRSPEAFSREQTGKAAQSRSSELITSGA